MTALETTMKAPTRSYRRSGVHEMRRAWRDWRRGRPFFGGLFTILGGVFMLYGPITAYRFVFAAPNTVGLGIAVGAAVTVLGLFFWFAPPLRQIVGVLVVLLSLLSLITSDLGGFVIGMVLGLVGGSLGFAWMPVESWKPHAWHRQARRDWKAAQQSAKAATAGTPAKAAES